MYPSSGLQTLHSAHRLKHDWYSARHGLFPTVGAMPMLCAEDLNFGWFTVWVGADFLFSAVVMSGHSVIYPLGIALAGMLCSWRLCLRSGHGPLNGITVDRGWWGIPLLYSYYCTLPGGLWTLSCEVFLFYCWSSVATPFLNTEGSSCLQRLPPTLFLGCPICETLL